MKLIHILCICITLVAITACNNNDSAVKQAARDSLVVPQGDAPAPVANTGDAAEPPQNADGVWHYICEAGCTGGAGAAGTCPNCGGSLTHNSAYHNSSSTTTNSVVSSPVTTAAGAAAGLPGAIPPAATPPKLPEPPQNAQGVWHYICEAGCTGGAGAAGACSKCGGALAHNTAYHN